MARVALDGQIARELAAYLSARGNHRRKEEVGRMLDACPRLREYVEADRDELMARDADEHALRSGVPWKAGDYRRVLADMRAGLPAWRSAKALYRTTMAVECARSRLRRDPGLAAMTRG